MAAIIHDSIIDDKCKVSVCMITYNHEAYVKKAIQSVYMQETDFPLELVLGDDASTDNTPEVIRSIVPPPHVRNNIQLRSVNLGMLKNFASTLQQCSGQYIALLEGDDYWIDPKKLQRQVDFLDKNPDFSICYHSVKFDAGTSTLKDDESGDDRDVSDIYDLARGNFMHTCSVVFRSNLFGEFPPGFYNSTVGDYFLHMLNAQHGKIKKIPGLMGVYRVHQGGIWSMQPNMDLKILTYIDAMIGCFEPEVEIILKRRYQDIAFRSFCNRIEDPDFLDRLLKCTKYGDEALRHGLKNIIVSERNSRKSIFSKFRGRLRHMLPFLPR